MLPDAEYCRISHFFTGQGLPTGGAVVYCVHIDAPQAVEVTAQDAHDNFGTTVVPWLCEDITLTSTLCKEGPDDTGGSAYISNPDYTGTEPDPSSPPGTAALVIKNTAGGGRRGKGRMFVPGLADAVVEDGGLLQSAFQLNLLGGLEDWQTAMAASGIPLYLEHGPETVWRLVGGQPRRIPVAGAVPDPTAITTLSLTNQVGTQRRRNRR